MVNWKNSESTDRLFATLIAAHPQLKLDYQAMAAYFGQGATYDAIEGRFRRYRKMAEELKSEARDRGITQVPRGRGSGTTTPRTPRVGRGITKNSSSSAKGKSDTRSNLTSPTRRALTTRSSKAGMSSLDAICLDDDSSNDDEKDTKVKMNIKARRAKTEDAPFGQGGAAALGQGDDPEVEIVGAPIPGTEPVGALFSKLEDRENSISNFSSFANFGRIKGEEGADRRVFPSAAPPIGFGRSGTTLQQSGLTEDPFQYTDMYFRANHAGYPMDNMYLDEHDGTA